MQLLEDTGATANSFKRLGRKTLVFQTILDLYKEDHSLCLYREKTQKSKT